MKILVTGAAGFIGYHLCRVLLNQGHDVHGLDNLNAYYDIALKVARLNNLGIDEHKLEVNQVVNGNPGFQFYYRDLIEAGAVNDLFTSLRPEVVIHLAAQAGVRHSIRYPQSFIDSNVQGFFNILEGCRMNPVKHLVYASSSSVYGTAAEVPFKESTQTDQPISLYGATKKAGEVLAHSYVELYKIPSTGLRFFTVYGPWGRPDMAYYKFADQIMKEENIDIYNNGAMERDFTFIDDIIQGIISVMDHPPSNENDHLHRILNIGRSSPVNLLLFIELLENNLGRCAKKNLLPLQTGEMISTWADTGELKNLTGYSPSTDLADGIRKFVEWYKSYHGIT